MTVCSVAVGSTVVACCSVSCCAGSDCNSQHCRCCCCLRPLPADDSGGGDGVSVNYQLPAESGIIIHGPLLLKPSNSQFANISSSLLSSPLFNTLTRATFPAGGCPAAELFAVIPTFRCGGTGGRYSDPGAPAATAAPGMPCGGNGGGIWSLQLPVDMPLSARPVHHK